MRIIARKTLKVFWERHAGAKPALEEWYLVTKKANGRAPADVTEGIPGTRHLGGNRFTFKIKGNHYRLIVKIDFSYGTVYIRCVGTHDEIGAKSV